MEHITSYPENVIVHCRDDEPFAIRWKRGGKWYIFTLTGASQDDEAELFNAHIPVKV